VIEGRIYSPLTEDQEDEREGLKRKRLERKRGEGGWVLGRDFPLF
jgi:hypothetical protein